MKAKKPAPVSAKPMTKLNSSPKKGMAKDMAMKGSKKMR